MWHFSCHFVIKIVKINKKLKRVGKVLIKKFSRPKCKMQDKAPIEFIINPDIMIE